MDIVINHLTRMSFGICVAGVDLETWAHVRPVLAFRNLDAGLLTRNDGLFDMAEVVRLGKVIPRPTAPHVEDYQFEPGDASRVERMEAGKFWALLARIARPTLSELFGPELKGTEGAGCIVDVGRGKVSLGCLVPASKPRLKIAWSQDKPRIRMELDDGQFSDLDLSVTDLRLYRADHVTPDEDMVGRVAKHMEGDREVILSVGLGRPYEGPGGKRVHWLQVNNIHFENYPVWQLR